MGKINSPATINSSITTRIMIRKKVKLSKNNLTKIPKTIEKRTRPFLYSFLRGLKKVFKRRGTENNCIK